VAAAVRFMVAAVVVVLVTHTSLWLGRRYFRFDVSGVGSAGIREPGRTMSLPGSVIVEL